MATLRKRGDAWRAEVVKHGIRKSATFATKAAAQAWAAATESEIAAGKSGQFPDKTFRDLLERYRDEVTVHKRGRRWETIRIEKILRESGLAAHRLSDLSAPDFAAWRDRRLRQVSGSSVTRELSLISHVFSVGVREWRWLAESPTKHLRRPQSNAPRDRLPSDDEIERICLAAGYSRESPPVSISQRVGACFMFAIETGMRAGEICGLDWERVDLKARVAHLPMTKNGSKRAVPLSTAALAILAQIGPRQAGSVFGLRPSQVDTAFRQMRDRAGVEDLTFHDSRHLAVTRLAKKLDVLDLARMIGHKSIVMLQVYYNRSAADIAPDLD